MNVFVLCTGRNGSQSFSRACQHITNYTSAHESRVRYLGLDRFAYPKNHIEVDNRLTWMLGRLYQVYGDDAFYVHMTRDENAVAQSHKARYDRKHSIIRAYNDGVLAGMPPETPLIDVCLDYCRTANANIEFFLQDRPNKMYFPLEQAKELFPVFWERIGAEGNLSAAMAEWTIRHNQSVVKGSNWQLQNAFAGVFYKGRHLIQQVLRNSG